MFRLIITLISLYYLIRTSTQLIQIWKSEEYVKKETGKFYRSCFNNKKIIILIPVFDEKKIICETISYFHGILKRFKNISLIFITTEKEECQKFNCTYQLIASNLHERMQIIHYPKKVGTKAHQLNYAITRIKEDLPKDNKITYIAVFDADSKPDYRCFEYIFNDSEIPQGYQMFSIYNEKLGEISLLNQANAVFQTRWSLSFELPQLIETYRKKNFKSLIYTIGHGIFLKSDLFHQFQFPEYALTEDLLLGYEMSLRDIFWKPIPFFDYCSVPDNFFVSIKQSARWFAGELVMYRTFLRYKNKTLKSLFLLIKRYFYLFQWGIGAPLFIFLMVYPLISKFYLLYLIHFFTIILYVIFIHKEAINIMANKGFNFKKKIFLFIGIKSLLNFLGPFYGSFRLLLEMLRIKPYGFFKTVR